MDYVRKKVDGVSHIITNTEKLEREIYSQLISYYKNREWLNRSRIYRVVDREVKRALTQFGKQRSYFFSNMSNSDGFGEPLEFEPIDLLAQVSETVVEKISLKEKIARLATDDRELVTLNAWANGFNDTQVSTTLASHFGGNKESHRKFVRRFKVKCQERLEKEYFAKNLLIKTA